MDLATRQMRAVALLQAAGVLPVVTVASTAEALQLADALAAGGLHTIELTLRTPVALEALAVLKRERPQLVVGAGTVLDAKQLRQALAAGADFIVTPGTPDALAQSLAEAPIPVIPGAATATELLALATRGFRVCKLFPAASLGGIGMVRALAGPLQGVVLCPTGGIGEADVAAYLAQPNVACVGGSWMLDPRWLAAGDFDRVTASARCARALAAQAAGAVSTPQDLR